MVTSLCILKRVKHKTGSVRDLGGEQTHIFGAREAVRFFFSTFRNEAANLIR